MTFTNLTRRVAKLKGDDMEIAATPLSPNASRRERETWRKTAEGRARLQHIGREGAVALLRTPRNILLHAINGPGAAA